MKMKILFLSWVLIFCASGNLAEAYDSGLLSAGTAHTCAIYHDRLKCWGGLPMQAFVPALKNPTSVSAGLQHTCAIDDEGVKCWGLNNQGQTNVPRLKNATSVSAGGGHTCAIDIEGVKCWGGNIYGELDVPALKNPTSISAGGLHTCAIDDKGIKCWGLNNEGQTDVPLLKNPTSVSAGEHHTCAIDSGGVKCWGSKGYGGIIVPPLKNPTSVSAGGHYTCAIDDDGVRCWGSAFEILPEVPPLAHPSVISSGRSHACAIDDEGVKCWGDNRYRQIEVPPLIFFELSRPEIFVDHLAHWSTLVRTSFFNSLKLFADDNLKSVGTALVPDQLLHGQYILMAFLQASIETGESTYYIENIIPAYNSKMKKINEQTGIHGLDQVKDFPLTRLTALKIMQVSLSTMTEFLIAEDRAHVQDIIKLIGLAMSDVSSAQNITNALVAIDTSEPITDKLNYSSKTQFLALTLKTTQQWLKAKIQ